MQANILVFDIETKHSFDEVGGRNNLEKLGVSLVCAYDYLISDYLFYMEDEIPKFMERLAKRPMLVGFNSKKFDIAVLQPYAGSFDLSSLPHIDLMESLQKVLGHRLSLQSVAMATLNKGKAGNGMDALVYYREGNWEKLKHYCMEDVKITKEIYEYGAKHGEVLYLSKYGHGKARAPVDWPMPESQPAPSQYDLF